MGTVGADQILSPEAALSTAIDVLHGERNAGGVLLDAHDLVPFQHLCARGLRASPQDRLEAGLGNKQPPAGAQRIHALVETGDDISKFAPRQAVHDDEGALGLELSERLLAHLLFDASVAEHLERAHMEERGTW